MTDDLTPTERVRLAMTLLAPLREAAIAAAMHASLVLTFCLNDARNAGAPAAICTDAEAAQRNAVWRRDCLAQALAELDGWMQAAEAQGAAA
jgi:hypothetical protein